MMGEPGNAISEIGRQTSSLGPKDAPSMAMDHDNDKKFKAIS